MIVNTTLLAAATPLIKLAVDMLKSTGVPSRWLPYFAFALGPVFVMLLMIANELPLNETTIANAIIVGLMAGGAAIGVTEAHKMAREPVKTVRLPDPDLDSE